MVTTTLTGPMPCVAFLKVASYGFIRLGNARLLNTKMVKLMMTMLFLLKIGVARAIK